MTMQYGFSNTPDPDETDRFVMWDDSEPADTTPFVLTYVRLLRYPLVKEKP